MKVELKWSVVNRNVWFYLTQIMYLIDTLFVDII